jgi:hypothetical protein
VLRKPLQLELLKKTERHHVFGVRGRKVKTASFRLTDFKVEFKEITDRGRKPRFVIFIEPKNLFLPLKKKKRAKK